MTLPLGLGQIDFQNLDIGDWVRGIFSSFIVGGSNAVVGGFVVSTTDPDKFNFGTARFYELVLSLFCASGLLNVFAFLRTEPLPDVKTVTTTISATGKAGTIPIVTTTVAETHIEAGNLTPGGDPAKP